MEKTAFAARPNAGQVFLEDTVIEDFLEDQPRAHQWREMRETLQVRLRDAITVCDNAAPGSREKTAAERKVRDLRDQVEALRTEEAVTQFVEDSVRASLSRPRHAGNFHDTDEEDDGG